MSARILVVDDDEGVRDMVASFLREEGYDFDAVDSINAARDLMESQDYDIMLIDKNMPGPDGVDEGGMDLLRLAKFQRQTSEVIMMTGFATIETAIEAMKLGAFDYIQKPFSILDLRRKIKRLFEYRSFINSDYTIEIYKSIQNEIINLVETRSAMSDKELDHALLALNDQIDKLFRTLKESERILLLQRESLARIASLAEELNSGPREDSFQHLVEEICFRSNTRL